MLPEIDDCAVMATTIALALQEFTFCHLSFSLCPADSLGPCFSKGLAIEPGCTNYLSRKALNGTKLQGYDDYTHCSESMSGRRTESMQVRSKPFICCLGRTGDVRIFGTPAIYCVGSQLSVIAMPLFSDALTTLYYSYSHTLRSTSFREESNLRTASCPFAAA